MTAIEIVSKRSLADNQALMKSLRQQDCTSFSAVSTYLRCPRQYKYRYIQLEPAAFIADDLVFGIAFHRVVAGYYEHLKITGEVLPMTKLLDDWEAVWTAVIGEPKAPVRFDKSHEDLMALGELMLGAFVNTVRSRRILGVEVPFAVDVVNPRTGEVLPVKLVGSIDLLEADNDGNIIVGELKTSGKKWSELDVEQNIQASVYAHAVAELGLSPREVLIRFDVVTKTKSPTMQQLFSARSARDLNRTLALVCDVQRAIEAQCFHANPSWPCTGCPFKQVCLADG